MMKLREISVLVYAIKRMMKTGHSNWISINECVRLTRSKGGVARVTYSTANLSTNSKGGTIKLAVIRKGSIKVVPYDQDSMSDIHQLYDVLCGIEEQHLNQR